jgi:hypothetical protein
MNTQVTKCNVCQSIQPDAATGWVRFPGTQIDACPTCAALSVSAFAAKMTPNVQPNRPIIRPATVVSTKQS